MARAAEALAAGRRPDAVLRGRAERDVVGLLRPRDRVSLRPGNPLAIGDLAEEPARVGEPAQIVAPLHDIDDAAIPHAMKPTIRAIDAVDLVDQVSPQIVGEADVKRLMKVADPVAEHHQRHGAFRIRPGSQDLFVMGDPL